MRSENIPWSGRCTLSHNNRTGFVLFVTWVRAKMVKNISSRNFRQIFKILRHFFKFLTSLWRRFLTSCHHSNPDRKWDPFPHSHHDFLGPFLTCRAQGMHRLIMIITISLSFLRVVGNRWVWSRRRNNLSLSLFSKSSQTKREWIKGSPRPRGWSFLHNFFGRTHRINPTNPEKFP